MATFDFGNGYTSPLTGTIADLILRPGMARARAAGQIGQVNAQAVQTGGDAAARGAAAVAAGVNGLARTLGDPKTQLESMQAQELKRGQQFRQVLSERLKSTPPVNEDGLQVYDTPTIARGLAESGYGDYAGQIADGLESLNNAARKQRQTTIAMGMEAAKQVERAGNDPEMALAALDFMERNKAFPQEYINHFRRTIQANPTPDTVAQFTRAAGGERKLTTVPGNGGAALDTDTGKVVYQTPVRAPQPTIASLAFEAAKGDPIEALKLARTPPVPKATEQKAVTYQGKPHLVTYDPNTDTYKYRGQLIDQGDVTPLSEAAAAAVANHATMRLDHAYTENSRVLTDLRKPLADQNERLGRVWKSIDQMTPEADALIAPEILTAMAGGQGSGFRMSEAEMARVIEGRSKWESLKAKLNQWNLDPSKALSVTDEQRLQMRKLVKEIGSGVKERLGLIDDAGLTLTGIKDVEGMRVHTMKTRQQIDAIAGPPDEKPKTGETKPGTTPPPGPRKTMTVGKVQALVDEMAKAGTPITYAEAKRRAESSGYTIIGR